MLKNQKGITLIALIITIIVMLILVGVTINVALNGGLFSKAEEATTKTKIAQVKEALAIKKAEIVADNNGVEPEYNLTVNDLTMSNELKDEFSDKLIIGKDGILYYNSEVVTNEDEQNIFESMGMQPYVEEPVQTRVPFTNYIENGNNYYIYGDKTSDSYLVATFSKESSTFTAYEVVNGQAEKKSENDFEIMDKSQIEAELGYSKEQIEQGTGITIDEANDDVIVWKVDETYVGNVFKSNYTQVIIAGKWYTLDTTYTLPTTE